MPGACIAAGHSFEEFIFATCIGVSPKGICSDNEFARKRFHLVTLKPYDQSSYAGPEHHDVERRYAPMDCRGFRGIAVLLVVFGAVSLNIDVRALGLGTGTMPPSNGQARPAWDAPPDGWNDHQRRGFHDGIDGAQKDYQNHRRPDVDNRDEYRHPNVPNEAWAVYREGFRRGYDQAMSHLAGGTDWRHRATDRPWDASPDGFSDIQRQGYRDGVEGARRDVDNHRRPDVNNRDEYRHPNLPSYQWDAYRDGFARGYQSAMSHLMGSGAYRPVSLPWDAPDPSWNDAERQGFQDGMKGAHRDIENHRQPDVNNRDEYRHPNISGSLREAYREGFREGYNRAMSHLLDGQNRY
jgi:hypothetical protein